jgi:hypothetical protein
VRHSHGNTPTTAAMVHSMYRFRRSGCAVDSPSFRVRRAAISQVFVTEYLYLVIVAAGGEIVI